jgi:hypothetical protein
VGPHLTHSPLLRWSKHAACSKAKVVAGVAEAAISVPDESG